MQTLIRPIGQVIFMRWADCPVRRMYMKSAFEHKPELRLSEFVIEKTVRISDESFERMLRKILI